MMCGKRSDIDEKNVPQYKAREDLFAPYAVCRVTLELVFGPAPAIHARPGMYCDFDKPFT